MDQGSGRAGSGSTVDSTTSSGRGFIVRIALFEHAGKVSYGVVEGEGDGGTVGLTVAEIDGLPFDSVRFTGQRWAAEDVRFRPPIYPEQGRLRRPKLRRPRRRAQR